MTALADQPCGSQWCDCYWSSGVYGRSTAVEAAGPDAESAEVRVWVCGAVVMPVVVWRPVLEAGPA